ncbi:MAG: hypothetical protein AAGI66_09360 [Cyanobacteria bacterium P01_H01_bin.74]
MPVASAHCDRELAVSRTPWTSPSLKIENSIKRYRTPWTITSQYCYLTNRDCDSCSAFKTIGFRFLPEAVTDDKWGGAKYACHMPYAIETILKEKGPPPRTFASWENYQEKNTDEISN